MQDAAPARRPESLDTSLEKGLRVLELLNDHVTVRVRDLHALTGIPKPTLVRVLKSLVRMGFVTRLPGNAGYSVSSRVIALSSGFHGVPRLVEVAGGFLDALTRHHLWPTALASLDFDAMVVRYSTLPLSPYSHKQSTIQRRLSLAERAHGRAYLAFCPQAELEAQLGQMRPETVVQLRGCLPQFRQQGWAVRDPEVEPQTRTIAVPLIGGDGRLHGTIGFTFFRRAVDGAEERRLAGALQTAAQQIMAAFESTPTPRHSS